MKKSVQYLLSLACILSMETSCKQSVPSGAQQPENAKDQVLLLVHADDLGLSHSQNQASIQAFEKEGISSASIMVPCPAFDEIAGFAKEHPNLDIGIHLTLTAEWDKYKWGGVLPVSEIPSLVDEQGHFYGSVAEVIEHTKPVEVEKELRAQIEKAIHAGIKPTHLDSHMGTMFMNPELLQIYQKLGREYNLPVFLTSNILRENINMMAQIDTNILIADQVFGINPTDTEMGWNEQYNEIINNMGPGLNVLIVHLAFDDDEMQEITINHSNYGATWRQQDYNYIVSEEFRNILNKNNIRLTTWKEMQVLFEKNQM